MNMQVAFVPNEAALSGPSAVVTWHARLRAPKLGAVLKR
jgi:hypothetical protein